MDTSRRWISTFVWPPPLQQQLTKTHHRQHLIANFRIAGMKLWNCDNRAFTIASCLDSGWATAAVTRTLQYAADIASSRNGQQMSAQSLQRRWKHEIQIALSRRRAAMARAFLHNPAAEWLLAGIIDGALHHWRHVTLLTVDLATTTTPTIPDDDGDIVSLASCTYESV